MKYLRFGPKGGLSPTLGDPCALCNQPLALGDYTTLVRRSSDGRYANDGTEVHWECAVLLVEPAQESRST